jgi:hypothetical protein
MRWLVVVALIGCGHSAGTTDGNSVGDDDANGDGPGNDGIVGMDAVIVPSCPAGQWCQETPPQGTGLLAAVSAANVNDVFAVGDGGTILRRHADAWAAMTSNTTANLRGVWAISPTNVWAAGSAGAIVHYDGTTWSAVTVPGVTSDLTGVWGSSASDVWIVGETIATHWNGSTWSSTGLGGILLGVSGAASNDVWACGETAYVRHYTTSWSSPISPIAANATYYAIVALGSEVWVTSAVPGKETLSNTTGTWVEHATAGGIVFQAMYMPAAGEVWAVGQTKVGHWTGAWDIVQPAPVTQPLYGVTGAANHLFVVGAGAMILHRD